VGYGLDEVAGRCGFGSEGVEGIGVELELWMSPCLPAGRLSGLDNEKPKRKSAFARSIAEGKATWQSPFYKVLITVLRRTGIATSTRPSAGSPRKTASSLRFFIDV
jgi:hypothetical protein